VRDYGMFNHREAPQHYPDARRARLSMTLIDTRAIAGSTAVQAPARPALSI